MTLTEWLSHSIEALGQFRLSPTAFRLIADSLVDSPKLTFLRFPTATICVAKVSTGRTRVGLILGVHLDNP